MKTLSKFFLLPVVLGLGLSGCSSMREAIYGRPTPLAPLTSSVLGAATRDGIVQQFGLPDEIAKRWFESFESEVYYYYDRDGSKGPPVEYQFLACEFSKGVLTGYSYHDSDVSAQRSFDENGRFELIKGKSTRQDVERLLGMPSGRALLPTTLTLPALDLKMGGVPYPLAKVPEEAKEVWQYYSQNLDDYLHKSAQKSLSVFFDAKGLFVGSALLRELSVKQ